MRALLLPSRALEEDASLGEDRREAFRLPEIARLLLESAQDDRLEFVKLMAEPMKSLLNARRKLDSESSRFRRPNGC